MVKQNKQQSEKKVLTAAQKMDGMARSLATLDQALYNLTRQVQSMQDAVSLLNDKVSAMVIALSSNLPVNDQVLDEINSQEKIKDMKTKVEKLVSEGVMEKSEAVTKNSFLVVREINQENGQVVNPRLQFVARILNEESLVKVLGKKTGDSIKFNDDVPASIEIEEIYEIKSNADQQQADSSETESQQQA